MVTAIATSLQTNPSGTYRWDVAGYHRLLDTGFFGDAKTELLDGNIYPVGTPKPPHEKAIRRILRLLTAAISEDIANVEKTPAIALSDYSEPLPDVALIRPDPNDYGEGHPTPQDVYLLIEVANSRPERDTKGKRKLYAEAGIGEYWVFVLETREMLVYRNPVNGDYTKSVVWTDDRIKLEQLPDISIDTKNLRQRVFG